MTTLLEEMEKVKRHDWLSRRELFASVHVDFTNGVYKCHRVVWHNEIGWRLVEGPSFAEAVDAAMRWQEIDLNNIKRGTA